MSHAQTIVVPLAEGFEEIEAVTLIDVLRRADLPVTVARLQREPRDAVGSVLGAHGIACSTDCALEELDPDAIRALVLPGGMPGTTHLQEDQRLLDLIRRLHAEGRMTAAICAAPMVLATAGVLGAGPATSHPSVRGALGEAEVLDTLRVVRTGTVWTSQGPGTALEFALDLVGHFSGPKMAAELAQAMLVHGRDDASRDAHRGPD